jgi:hypothetical protein
MNFGYLTSNEIRLGMDDYNVWGYCGALLFCGYVAVYLIFESEKSYCLSVCNILIFIWVKRWALLLVLCY